MPASSSLRRLQRAVQDCKGCPLHADTTQAVFGEGSRSAPIVLVGEQPGDQEDKQGHPFVGPAGGVLWRCLDDAGIDRDAVFVTNAVKHFKHEDRGKRRLHKKPDTAEVEACHPWIDAELRAVEGRVIVALGATAARSLFGRTMPIAANRGRDAASRGSAGDRHLPPLGRPACRRRSGGDPGGAHRGPAACQRVGRRRCLNPPPPARCGSAVRAGRTRTGAASCTRPTSRSADGSSTTSRCSTRSSSTRRSIDCPPSRRSRSGRTPRDPASSTPSSSAPSGRIA